MKVTLCCFLLLALLQIMSWESVVVARRSFPGPEETPGPMSSPWNTVGSEKGLRDKEVMSDTIEKTDNIGVRKIGSIPPSCEHKCYGCTPCEAIQVPSTSRRRSHLGLQYANYEPESWKCKCGPSLYSP